MATLTYRTGTN